MHSLSPCSQDQWHCMLAATPESMCAEHSGGPDASENDPIQNSNEEGGPATGGCWCGSPLTLMITSQKTTADWLASLCSQILQVLGPLRTCSCVRPGGVSGVSCGIICDRAVHHCGWRLQCDGHVAHRRCLPTFLEMLRNVAVVSAASAVCLSLFHTAPVGAGFSRGGLHGACSLLLVSSCALAKSKNSQ